MNSLQLILSTPKYFAPVWVFASLNIMTGTWVLYIPRIKDRFSMDDGELGLALFNLALGLLCSIPLIPLVNRKIGIGRSTLIGIVLFAALFNLPLMASSYTVLCIGLFITGLCSGFTDVSMNALIATIEKRDQVHIMSAAHGFFSLGGFIGAMAGTALLTQFTSPSMHMLAVAGFIIISNLILSAYYHQVEAIDPIKETKGRKIDFLKPLLALAVLAFIIMCSEGAVEHWSNLFLYEIVGTAQSRAGAGFVAFSLCMTIGRFFGDGISKRLGAQKVITYGCLIAFGAYFLIISADFYITVLGFGCLGLGLSVIIPELFRIAGQTKGVPASEGISLVTGIGFLGFLIGPVLLGFIAKWTSLISSFLFLALLTAIGFFLVLAHFSMRKK